MGRYIIRRLLWVVVLLFVVSALTFLIFYLLPSADPAVLRAGRQPQPGAHRRRSATSSGSTSRSTCSTGLYMKSLVLHFDFGYSYQNAAGPPGDLRAAAGDDLARRVGARGHLAAGRHRRRHHLRDQAPHAARPRSRWAARSSRSPRRSTGSASSRSTSSPSDIGRVPDLPRRRQLRAAHRGPGAVVHARCSCRGSCWRPRSPRSTRGCCVATCIETMSRGLHPHGAGEGPARAARWSGATACARRSRRSSPSSASTSAILLGGAILTETVFNIPGIGRSPTTRSSTVDLPVIQGTVLFGAFFIVVANLVVDILYAFLDPRVRYDDCRRRRCSRSRTCASRSHDRGRRRARGRRRLAHASSAGRTLGIVGESGSGKTVSSLTVMGLTRARNARSRGADPASTGATCSRRPTSELRGVRGNDIAMIFQDPLSSLHPFYTVGEQLVEAIRAHRDVPKAQAADARDRAARARRHPRPARRARQLPARVLGRHAPARDDRDGAGQRAEAADRRRADDGARRDRPGADPRADRAAAGRARHGRDHDHPRPRRRRRDGRRRSP